MHRIDGLTDAQLAAYEDRAEAAMRSALQQVMDQIADRILAQVQTSSGYRALWTGCRFCLNPRHPGPCAKPKGPDSGSPGHGHGGGGGGGGGSGVHGEEGSMRPSLRDAKTTEDVSAAVAAEASTITGRKVTCDMTGSDPQIAREHGEAILQDLELFPHAPVASIHTYGPGSARPDIPTDAAYAVTRHGTSNAIAFNAEFAGSPTKYHASLKGDADQGWVTAASPAGVAHHEFGHVLAQHTQTATSAKAHVSSKARTVGEKPSALTRDQISGYAATNAHELAAEAFADVTTRGKDASPLSHDVYAFMDGAYRAAYGGGGS